MKISDEKLLCRLPYALFLYISVQQSLEAVVAARKIIIAAGIPFSRPEGYFCEMLKTEEQMGNIVRKKSEDQAAVKAAEEARKQRFNRKYGKKVQIQKELEKQQKRSEGMKKLPKTRKRPPTEEKDEFEVGIEPEDDVGRESRSKKFKGEKAVSQKRQIRNEKYGFGGKKWNGKKNDKTSVDQDGFDAIRNRKPFRGMNGIKQKKRPFQRPGKQRRQQLRNRKNAKK